jgi:hypothetical protein
VEDIVQHEEFKATGAGTATVEQVTGARAACRREVGAEQLFIVVR